MVTYLVIESIELNFITRTNYLQTSEKESVYKEKLYSYFSKDLINDLKKHFGTTISLNDEYYKKVNIL